jgi:hypothetical protein
LWRRLRSDFSKLGFVELLDADELVLRLRRQNQLVKLRLQRLAVSVLRVLQDDTIRKVIIVVLMLMTSWQFSE